MIGPCRIHACNDFFSIFTLLPQSISLAGYYRSLLYFFRYALVAPRIYMTQVSATAAYLFHT